MTRPLQLLFGLTLTVFLCAAYLGPQNDAPVQKQSELTHTVYFWLNNGADTEAFEQGLNSLREIPSVNRLDIVKPASTPSRGVVDNSFDYALVVYFDDVAGHDAYQEHPVHLKFVSDHEAKFKEVRVYDHVGG